MATEDPPSARPLLADMSGIDLLRAMTRGDADAAPMAATTNIRLDTVEPGRVSFRGTAEPRHCNPFGAVHGGWFGVLLDSALGCAVLSLVPQGRWYTTLDYGVNLTRALASGTEVICTAEVMHSGRTTAVARGEIRGARDGKLYATGQTTCLIMDLKG
ncbi:hotdog fold thioesterase [Frigidibacter albus]|uniref:Hotdog fold thioesterase n=1 Tax=Frigidibacter albus TaxID=1465486 RepID=A0A6L8VFW9_9RHOB|nr:PaaI family thioesterase [Frigidibacter albus]MZQ88581.1 hotdog fold thioesterase [Frigidibacter albus]NBE30610.1 hotdog fold thioesterase [Frigidibacter albus]GGH49287.1 thioesterase [Frigidibacter albus]